MYKVVFSDTLSRPIGHISQTTGIKNETWNDHNEDDSNANSSYFLYSMI